MTDTPEVPFLDQLPPPAQQKGGFTLPTEFHVGTITKVGLQSLTVKEDDTNEEVVLGVWQHTVGATTGTIQDLAVGQRIAFTSSNNSGVDVLDYVITEEDKAAQDEAAAAESEPVSEPEPEPEVSEPATENPPPATEQVNL